MFRVLSIFLSVYLLAGTVLLPNGDFGFTYQLSKLYDEFIQLNGSASFDEFLEEELLDPYAPPDNDTKDEPFEKECHPVPLDLITVHANSTFYTVESAFKIIFEPAPEIRFAPFTELYHNADLEPVFHPPNLLIPAQV